jgi:hypothetical protein
MNIKKANYAKYLISVSVVILFAWLHQTYVTRAHPDAVYMDSLRLVYQLEQWRLGHLSFFSFWGLGAEHQGFINQILLLLNVKYFSFNVMLANRLTGIIVALVAMIVLLDFNSKILKFSKEFPNTLLTVRIGISALITLICFSWAGFELFTLDLGLPLWIKNLSFVTYFAAHAYYLAMPTGGRRPRVIGLGLTLVGPVIVLMIGMGWSYSFVAAVLAVNFLVVANSIRKRDVRATLLKSGPVIALLLAQILYVMASIGVGDAPTPHKKFSILLQIPELSLYALGSGLIGVETIVGYPALLHVLPYVSGAALVAAVMLMLARYRLELHSGSLLPVYLLGYGFLTALSVSAARGGDGAMAVMASRYYMDIMFFYVGLVWLWHDSLEHLPAIRSRVSMVFFLALCLVVAAGQFLTYKKEWAAAPYRALAFRAMNQALLNGVADQQAANLLQSPLENARKGDQVLLEHHLALYSNLSAGVCKADHVRYLSGWYARESQGVWMGRTAVMQVPACRCEFVAHVYLPPGFPGRVMVVSDSETRQTIDLAPGKEEQLRISASDVPKTLNISVSRTTVPASLSDGAHDVRDLGGLWTSSAFVCGGNAAN